MFDFWFQGRKKWEREIYVKKIKTENDSQLIKLFDLEIQDAKKKQPQGCLAKTHPNQTVELKNKEQI